MASSTVEAKQALRREHLARRRALPADEQARISADVARRLVMLPELLDARTLLLYAAQPDEVDVSGLPAALATIRAGQRDATPCTILLPRVVDTTLELAVADGADADGHDLLAALRPGTFGLLEPPEGSRVIDAGAVDVAVVPGVAFSPGGHRLGRGGGYYDRLLSRLRADCLVVGVCAAANIAEVLPSEPHDRPVDVVITDASLWRRPATDGRAPT